MVEQSTTYYVGIRTFPDPTANEAVDRVSPSHKLVTNMQQKNLAEIITVTRQKLEALNAARKSGQLTRTEFSSQREPLVQLYKALSQNYLSEKGGK